MPKQGKSPAVVSLELRADAGNKGMGLYAAAQHLRGFQQVDSC